MKKTFLLLLCSVSVFAQNCPNVSRLDYADEAACYFDWMADNYNKITEGTIARLEGPVDSNTTPYVGEDRKGAYGTDARLNIINGFAQDATKGEMRLFSDSIGSLAELSAKIQELDLLITEMIIARNQLKMKKREEGTIKKKFSSKEK